MKGNAPVVRLERADAIAVLVIDNPPVNATSQAVRAALSDAIAQISADHTVRGAVIIGAGSTFIAGADIREFGKPLAEPHLPDVLNLIAACPKPVVAAIDGAALGGGFETALACDARVATESAAVGLPEVKLGVIPGAGGTQRLPRLLGIARAIGLVTSGRRVPAREALSLGLVDAIAEGDLRTFAIEHARSHAAKRRLSDLPIPEESQEQIDAVERDALRKGRGQPAIAGAIEAVKASAATPFTEGLAVERRIFLRLRESEQAEALRYLFFAEREAPKVAGLEDAKPRPVGRVGVLGAGTMGAGIAVAFADAGLEVALVERDAEAAEQGRDRVKALYDRSVASGRISPVEAERRLARITPTDEFGQLGNVDLAIEAVFEDMAVKQKVFRRLDAVAKPGAILASNTSYLDLDRIAGVTGRPQDVVGLHFFSPANVMRLVEVVRGVSTADEVLATALATAKRIGKLPIVARVGEGFVGNRIFSAYRRQCEFLIEEGAYPEDVDAALEGYGFAMGLFAVSDLAGLDIAWKTRQRLAASRDPRERYVEIPDRLCERGRLGRKTGAGWYRYGSGAHRGEPDPEVRTLIEAESARKGIARRSIGAEEVRRRAIAAMVNEGAKVLADGIAQRASDIDVALVNGYGFPAYRGGPMFQADRRGLAAVLADVQELQKASGFGWEPASLLVELAKAGSSFASWLGRADPVA